MNAEPKVRPFCILADQLPRKLTVDGREIGIDTRTATAVCCIRKLRQPLPGELKRAYILKRLGLPCSEEAIRQANAFLSGPPTGKPNPPKPAVPVFDYEQDAPAIVAAFYQAYGLSLEETATMHWWLFLTLLANLPGDTRLMETIHIRSMPINPKDPAKVQRRKRAAKAAVALKDTRTPAQKKQDVQQQFNHLGL